MMRGVGEGVISLFFVGESLPEEEEEGAHRRDRSELARKPSSLAEDEERWRERALLA